MRRVVLLAFLPVLLVGCGRSSVGNEKGADAVKPVAPDTVPRRFARRLGGMAGEDRVRLWLRREDDVLSGAWSVGEEEWWLSGTFGGGGAVTLPVYGEDGEQIGTFEGTLAAGADGLTLTGRLLATGEEPVEVALAEERVMVGPSAHILPRSWLEEDAEYGWSFHAEIPTVESLDGSTLAPPYAAFNAAVDSMVRSSVSPFQEAVLEDVQTTIAEGVAPEGTSSWESSYEVMLAEEGIVSMRFDVSDYYAGAAHPNHYTWTLTWDFDAGREVPLDALFRSGAPYLQTLSDYAIPDLVQQLGPELDRSWIEEGAGPTAENYTSWTLTPEGLRIDFDPYQVAPYAAGPQMVVVRWSALEPLLDPAGPVARIAR